MTFDNLPIEFDDEGNPILTDEARFAVPGKHDGVAANGLGDGETNGGERVAEEPAERDGHLGESVKDVNIDPVTRVAGALAFHAKADLENREVLEAHSQATLFRGYEIILEGRDPRDAIDLSSRACGVCGAVHSIVSSMALEMAFPVEPPPMGVWARNMGQAAAFLYDHSLHLFLLAGPDYSESLLSQSNPDVVEQAKRTSAPHADVHGYETVGEIMTAMNPLEGELYLEALENTREARQAASLMLGKYPHPSTIAPGGLTTTLTRTSFQQFYTRLNHFFDYAKKVAFVWDDLLDFLLENLEGYEHVGERPINLVGTGIWDDPAAYNARYEDADEWGLARLSTPGVIVDGELVTTNLTDVDMGIEEFVDHSYYEDWTDDDEPRFSETPSGGPISPYHPWNKETRPKPEGKSWREKYTWGTSPRWDRQVMETGPHSRHWLTAMAEEVENPYIEPTGDGLNLHLPETEQPEMTLRWDVPDRLNAAERMRAKAYHVAYCSLVCYTGFVEALDLLKQGESDIHAPFEVPSSGTRRGVGFWEAGRGYLTHHVVIEDGVIDTYQILTPSTWMASPTDPFGNPGPYEEAALNTPLLEDFTDEEDFSGMDILRSIRSFDPCMPCTVHLHTDRQRDVIAEDVTSCGCSFTDGDQPAEEAIRDIISGD
ncbi:nickel-dependent hydrogenase large subunit [Natronococcus wangiae]|uniref:nickel-dependent hydrogenase large subunit n=1 Tax=Natronococcus wangiae TaxID=3068275 RepID=UPI00273DCF91|nr:nickel-dependent hydrogenase large subunit [Natronococcus sp. AD5]